MSAQQENSYIPKYNESYYEKHVVLISYLDDSWTVRRNGKTSSGFNPEGAYNFTRTCLEYRKNVEANCRAFSKANQEYEDKTSVKNGKSGHFIKPYLFNPASYVAFGHTDEVGIVLLDDFDAIFTITGDSSTIVDRCCIAFCPTLKQGLGLEDNKKGPFCEIHELLNKDFPQLTSPSEFSAPVKQAKTELPLMVVTEFKLNTLAVLKHGALMKKAILRKMAKHIQDTQIALENEVANSNPIKEKDIEPLKCVLLEAQGPTDIVLLTFCKNYSEAMTLVYALRTLNFGLFKEYPDIAEQLEKSHFHKEYTRELKEANNKKNEGSVLENGLENQHIFYSSYTTLAFAHNLKNHPEQYQEDKRCTGEVMAHGLLNIKCGHSQLLNQKNSDCVQSDSDKSNNSANCHFVLAGPYDRMIDFSDVPQANQCLLSVEELINQLKKKIEDFQGNLSDITTLVAVPIPKGLNSEIYTERNKNDLNTSALYHRMYRKLFRKKLNGTSNDSGTVQFDIGHLQKSLRQLLIPTPLSKSLVYLYHALSICLNDPHLFMSALTFYDVLNTLYQLLTEYLPGEQNKSANDHQKQTFINDHQIEEFCDLIEVLRYCLDLNKIAFLPGDQKRDMSIDFRGGLNQFIASADTLVQCGTDLFKQTVQYYQSKDKKQKNDVQCCVGIIKQINFHPQTKFNEFDLKSDKHIIGVIEMNASHLFNPNYFIDYFHEIGHLIFDFLLSNQCFKEDESKYCIDQLFHFQKRFKGDFYIQMRERLDEIFAWLFVHLFIFKSDYDLFLEWYFIRYLTTPLCTDDVYRNQKLRLNEIMSQAFLIREAIRRLIKKNGKEFSKWNYYEDRKAHPSAQNPNKTQRAFEEFYEKYEPYINFLYSNKYKNKEEESKAFRKIQLHTTYFWTYWYMQPLLKQVLEIHQHCIKDENDSKSQVSKIGEIMRKHIKENFTVDTLKRIHIHRDPDTGRVNYDNESEVWNEIQIDQHRGGLFCASPLTRSKRIHRQITDLKNLWDISTRQGARSHLKMMVGENNG